MSDGLLESGVPMNSKPLFHLIIPSLLLMACETRTIIQSTPAPSADALAATPDDQAESADGGLAVDAAAADTCAVAIPKKAKCGNNGAWVRGVAHFDPAKVSAAKPVLRVVLRHSFVLVDGEEKIGGRLHGWTSVPITDPSKGEVPFAIDMSALATMWSEENGAFHVVLIIDEDDNNDLDNAGSLAESLVIGTPGANELAKIVDVEVSCHAEAACLDVNIDCTGPDCTTIEPMAKCTAKKPGCGGSGFCK